jgi:hypothetical protein
MSIKDVVGLIAQLLAEWITKDKNFTGNIVVTVHCRNGGIGKVCTSVNQDYQKIFLQEGA